jgi:hypothetical protein
VSGRDTKPTTQIETDRPLNFLNNFLPNESAEMPLSLVSSCHAMFLGPFYLLLMYDAHHAEGLVDPKVLAKKTRN